MEPVNSELPGQRYCLFIMLSNGEVVKGKWQRYVEADVEQLRHLLNGPGTFQNLEIATREGWTYIPGEVLNSAIIRLVVQEGSDDD